MHREHQDPATQTEFGNPRRGFESVHFRHRDIENHDIRFQRLYGLKSFFSVPGFPADFPFRSGSRNQRTNTLPHDLMIIHQQNPSRHSSSHSPVRFQSNPIKVYTSSSNSLQDGRGFLRWNHRGHDRATFVRGQIQPAAQLSHSFIHAPHANP